MQPPLLLLTFYLSPLASAWGNLAHRTIALVAENHILPSTSHYINSLLDNISISDAAIWADAYKLLPEGRHTSGWHFINTHDHPPQDCHVSYTFEPTQPCIIDAITNMTWRVNDLGLGHEERKMGLMFLLHLIGDLHCPLHVEGLMRGGNDIAVFWEGRNTSLHFVWDVSIPQKLTSSTEVDEKRAAILWAEKLSREKLDFWSPKKGWFLNRIQGWGWRFAGDRESLVLNWAREVNSVVCQAVLRDGVESVEGKELSDDYYQEAVPVVESLVQSAGMRLAAWMNELATAGSLSLGKASSEQKVFR